MCAKRLLVEKVSAESVYIINGVLEVFEVEDEWGVRWKDSRRLWANNDVIFRQDIVH